MISPVFTLLYGDTYLSGLLGDDPFRVYPFSKAPQNCARPYVTYTVYDGTPVNALGDLPDREVLHTQIDVWAEDVSECHYLALAIRDLLEPHGHMTSFAEEAPEIDTGLFRYRLDFDFNMPR